MKNKRNRKNETRVISFNEDDITFKNYSVIIQRILTFCGIKSNIKDDTITLTVTVPNVINNVSESDVITGLYTILAALHNEYAKVGHKLVNDAQDCVYMIDFALEEHEGEK